MGRDGQHTGALRAGHDAHTHPPGDGPQEANWLAAYAMGLASAKRRVDASLPELAKAADGRPERLVEASERLQELDDFDHRLRRQAQRLLTACLEHLEHLEGRRSGGRTDLDAGRLNAGARPDAAPTVTDGDR